MVAFASCLVMCALVELITDPKSYTQLTETTETMSRSSFALKRRTPEGSPVQLVSNDEELWVVAATRLSTVPYFSPFLGYGKAM